MYPNLGHKVGVLGERKLPHWPSDQRELIIADLTACVEEKGKVDIYQIAALRLSTPKGVGKQVWKAVLAALAQILMIAIVVCDICESQTVPSFLLIPSLDFLLLAVSDWEPKRFLQRMTRENPTHFRSGRVKSKRSVIRDVVP